MEFQRRKIRTDRLSQYAHRRESFKSFREKLKPSQDFKFFTPKKTIILSAIVAFVMIFTAYKVIKGISLRSVVFSLGKDLQEDNYGHTNILLLGTGGGEHEGADLTDTIIVASINQKTNQVTLLSVPRDFYITDKKVGSTRINNLYHIGKNELGSAELGINMLEEHIKDVTGIQVQYYLKLDFQGFKEIVDALGGVDVNIPEALYDPMYPKGENIGYEILSISAGQQHLDGETALKYARSRHSTSDFDRSTRQQIILYALKETAEQKGVLGDTGKLQDIYDSLQKYIDTDLALREILTLGKIGSQIKRENIVTYRIHDDPAQCGGLLYTPARDLYNGASVLVAARTDNGDIHNLTDIALNHPEIKQSGLKLQILNGTKGIGLAAETKIILNRLCLNVIRFGNGQTKDVPRTTYYLKKDISGSTLEALQKLIPGVVSMQIPPKYLEPQYVSDADIIIELGADYLPRKMKDSFDGIVSLTPTVVSGEAAPKDTTTGTGVGTSTAPIGTKVTTPTAKTPTTKTTTPAPTPTTPKKK
ncbi:LCP family protein [Candidatus Gracilibacteria bacterium]|nr:LCP family protein [Candidatus Gracilibacteria bacterium]